MATGDYCTVGELKQRIWPTGDTPDNLEDIMLQSIITAVSREIDALCGRRFWTTSADETRYFTARHPYVLYPGVDVISITSLAVDYDGDGTHETALAATDYQLLPLNAVVDNLPYSHICITPASSERFPAYIGGVEIVGKFGWSNAPNAVKEACILQSVRLWRRRDAPFGVISNPAGGDMRLLEKIDPDVQMLLHNYRKWV